MPHEANTSKMGAALRTAPSQCVARANWPLIDAATITPPINKLKRPPKKRPIAPKIGDREADRVRQRVDVGKLVLRQTALMLQRNGINGKAVKAAGRDGRVEAGEEAEAGVAGAHGQSDVS